MNARTGFKCSHAVKNMQREVNGFSTHDHFYAYCFDSATMPSRDISVEKWFWIDAKLEIETGYPLS